MRRIHTYHPAVSPSNDNKGIVDTYLYYDLAGRPDSLVDYSVPVQSLNGDKTIFLYDGRGQLTSVTGPGIVSSYTYDASGNRITETSSGQSIGYEIPSGTNRLQRRIDNLGSYYYRYDDNGAVLADSTHRPYSGLFGSFRRVLKSYYDAAGRLAAVKLDSLVYNALQQPTCCAFSPPLFEYRYDALGRLIVRQTTTGSSMSARYDGNTTLALQGFEIVSSGLDEPLMLLAPAGEAVCGVSVMYYTTYGSRMFDFHKPTGASCIVPGGDSWENYGKNSGAIAGSYSFGLSASSGFSGLSFFRNRSYDSRSGRFTQEDPIGFSGGSNLYAYAGNNPASFTDPFGLSATATEDTIYTRWKRPRIDMSEPGLSGPRIGPAPIDFRDKYPCTIAGANLSLKFGADLAVASAWMTFALSGTLSGLGGAILTGNVRNRTLARATGSLAAGVVTDVSSDALIRRGSGTFADLVKSTAVAAIPLFLPTQGAFRGWVQACNL